jgi:hypothetical protein
VETPSTLKPLLFLDVDGVLNVRSAVHSEHYLIRVPVDKLAKSPFTRTGPPGTSLTFFVGFNPLLRTWLAELSSVFELAWATTWEHCANEYLSPLLGLGDLLVAEPSKIPITGLIPESLYSHVAEWKWPAIKELAGDRPLAFVDDSATRMVASPHEMLDRTAPTLVIAPEYYLTRAHVDELLAFGADPYAYAQEHWPS